MIVYRKQGRKSTKEVKLVEKISKKLNSMPSEDTKDYRGRVITNEEELQSFWDSIESKNEQLTIDEPIIKEPMENTSQIDYEPLSGEVKQRGYNKHDLPPEFNSDEIPEPIFNNPIPTGVSEPQPQSQQENDKSDGREAKQLNRDWKNGDKNSEQKEKSAFDNITNPSINQLEGKEQNIAVEQLVDTVLDVYAMAHGFGANMVKMDDEKLTKLYIEDIISPEMQVPISESGEMASFPEFVAEYNKSIDTTIHYDQSFGDTVKPVMIRVFKKRGWGLNDEQYLMYMFGKDIAQKTMIAIGMKKQMNFVIDMLAKTHKQQKEASEKIPTIKPDSIRTETIHKEPMQEKSTQTVVEDAQFVES